MKTQKMYYLLLLIFLNSCIPHDPIPPPPPINKHENILKANNIWSSEFKIDTTLFSVNSTFIKPLIIGNKVVFQNWQYSKSEKEFRNESFYIYDRFSGKELARFQPGYYKRFPYPFTSYADRYLLVNLVRNGGFYCYDLENLSLNWKINSDFGEIYGRPEVHGKYAYYKKVFGRVADSIQVKRVDIITGETERIFSISKNQIKDYYIFLDVPNIITNENNDIIYYCTMEGLPYVDGPSIVNYRGILAYNITKRKMLWITEIEKQTSLSARAPVIYNNLIIFAGDKDVYAYNRFNGTQVWKSKMPDMEFNGFGFTRILLAYDKLFVKSDNFELYCLNPENGNVVWINLNCGAAWAQNRMEYLDQILYFSSGSHKIHAIDMNTGKILWEERSPYKHPYGEFSWSGLELDKEEKIIYISDDSRALAFKLPKK